MPALFNADTIAVLDVGSSKIACGIADIHHGTLRILGLGYHASIGMRGGMITDMERLQHSISRAVHHAEEQIRDTIRHVWVSLSGTYIQAHRAHHTMALSHKPITSSEIASVLAQTTCLLSPNLSLVHNLPLSFTVDQAQGLTDPSGLYGSSLEAHAYNIYAPSLHLKNLRICLNRCHVDVRGFLYGPYVAALSGLTEEEKDIGCIFVDIGSALTSVCIIHKGQLVYTQIHPLGSQHITQDIAQAFSISIAQAERLKVLCGLLPHDQNDATLLSCAPYEHDNERVLPIPSSTLQFVMEARVVEILDTIIQMVDASGLGPYVGQHIVLSGGGAQLKGLKEKAHIHLRRPIRLSEEITFKELQQHPNKGGLICLAGMVRYVHHIADQSKRLETQLHRSVFKKIGFWIKENI